MGYDWLKSISVWLWGRNHVIAIKSPSEFFHVIELTGKLIKDTNPLAVTILSEKSVQKFSNK